MRRVFKSLSLGLGYCAASLACTSTALPAVSIDRRDYILAHAHGWVEVSILDVDVPAAQSESTIDGKREVSFVRPGYCSVDIELDGEEFVSSQAFPVGEAAPYEVSTGFRFPAPVGPATLSLEYRYCNGYDENGDRISTTIELPVRVFEGQVNEIHFDGARLVANPPRPDPVVTIDDVYEALTGRRTALPE